MHYLIVPYFILQIYVDYFSNKCYILIELQCIMHTVWRTCILELDFFEQLIKKYENDIKEIYITNEESKIITASKSERLGSIGLTAKYIISTMKPTTIQSQNPNGEELINYGIPIIIDEKLLYIIVLKSESPNLVTTGNKLANDIYCLLEYKKFLDAKAIKNESKRDLIASTLIKEEFDYNQILYMMAEEELNPDLLRCIICIRLHFHNNRYFNINLSLGYESAIEQSRKEVFEQIKSNKHLNSQDLLYLMDRNTIIIIKSFLPTKQIDKVYLAINTICQDISETLSKDSGYNYSIAYGDFYHNLKSLSTSLREATSMIELGSENNNVLSIKDLLLSYISKQMPSYIRNQTIRPLIKNLKNENNELTLELIQTANIYVDNCMNMTLTAHKLGIHRNTVNARLQKFEEVTQLRPNINFKDAFIIKMLALQVENIII